MQPVKNKKLTYLLICAVAAVWGIIIYKVLFNNTDDDFEPKFKTAKEDHEPYDQYLIKNDTFKLVLNYRDPFLGGMTAASDDKNNTAIASEANFIPPPPPPPPIDWSLIKYSGYIVNPATKKLVAILVINGREQMTAEGQTFEGVKLLQNRKDSILVSWQGKKKYIKQ
nr:hypothetical protein [Pedobacter panaciterrae]